VGYTARVVWFIQHVLFGLHSTCCVGYTARVVWVIQHLLYGLYITCCSHNCSAREADRFTALPRCRKTVGLRIHRRERENKKADAADSPEIF
jgi:hypothetical protein